MSDTTRRGFLGAAASLALAQDKPRPNILWITAEDHGPHLGCYGDSYANTPNLDSLAARGMLYRTAWSNAPVCAPARTALISGLYPPSTGSEHMRSLVRLPAGMKMYPQYLREAGYYCTNNSKEDYNLEKPGSVWDESSPRAHWRNRKPGQPFFAIFNFTGTHESQVRRRPHTLVHDMSKVRLPAYHPDTPEVRHDWAQYHDNITDSDKRAGTLLKELEEAGLDGDTIVFYYADHGPGLPRSKRWPYDSGLRVPMIVYFPEKWRSLAPKEYSPGAKSDRLVSFVDLAPTLLSLAGIKPPAHFQGHAFLGEYAVPAPEYLFGFRGRMDERYDLVRSVRDRRYVYLRQFMPHLPYGQHVNYMMQMPTAQAWKRLYEEGKLSPPRTFFWEAKPAEELYDLESDPDEVKNLAGSLAHRPILERMRQALHEHTFRIRDVGFLPESEIHARSQGSTPYEMGHDDTRYPLGRLFGIASFAASGREGGFGPLLQALADADSGVRYWGAMGLLMRGAAGVSAAAEALRKVLDDKSAAVRIVAAQALALHGAADDVGRCLAVLLDLARCDRGDQSGYWAAIQALNALDALGKKASPAKDAIAKLPRENELLDPRLREYAPRLLEHIEQGLG